MAKEMYSACTFCTQFSDISKCHRDLTYLTDLLRNSTLDVNDKMLFRRVQETLLDLSVKFRFFPNKKKNRLASKYYIYFMKHKHLVDDDDFSPAYSPLRRDEVVKEFEEHLKAVLINI